MRFKAALSWCIGSAVVCLSMSAPMAQRNLSRGLQAGEWRDYAGDSYGMKYSPLAQITRANVRNLEVAWRWASADQDTQKSNALYKASRYEDTPIMVNGVLYTATPLGMVAALDPATGRTKWVYDPGSYKAGKPHSIGHAVRGVSYWTDGRVERILHSTNDAFLISLDAKTGLPDPKFGVEGKVDIADGVGNAVRSINLTGRRATIAGNIAVLGTAVLDPGAGKESEVPKGYVLAFDIRTGKKLWTFNLIPLKGEAGYDTWLNDSAERTGNANAWGGMSYDPESDYVYFSTSAPGNDYYGATRPGANLFSDSIVCVEAKTGKRVWHYQGIHHDLWDWDFVTHPALVDISVNGRAVKAVVGLAKQGFVFVLDRKTGAPIFPITETAVPQANTPNNEWTSPTQPIPTTAFQTETVGSTPDSLIDFTPELKTRAMDMVKSLELGPVYTPSTMKGTLRVPGSLGGANWGGAAFDPETGVYYVPTRMTFDVQRPRFPDGGPPAPAQEHGAAPPAPVQTNIDGLPIIKAPYSRVTAIDMNKGEKMWVTPLGNGPRNHPLLKDLNLPPLGDAVLGGAPMVTKTLLFVGVTYTFVNGMPQPTSWERYNDPGWQKKMVYVFDKKSGEIVHVIESDSMGAAGPMTYLHRGRQYLVVAQGNAEKSELVAYALPVGKS